MSSIAVAVVDTDVFSHLFVHRNSLDPRVPGWRDLLRDRRVLISFQTRAEHHAADRWVAASAMAKGATLLAGDGIYRGAPGLNLLF